MMRRRCNFLETLDRKSSPSGREIFEPRTPEGLHPAPTAPPLESPSSASNRSTQIRRHAGSGRGMALPADPLTRGSGGSRHTTAGLHRAPPPKEACTCTKSTAGDPASSKAPPAEELTNPTLSTTEKRGSPALPPPERPTEDEGSGETSVRRWICGRVKKSPLSVL